MGVAVIILDFCLLSWLIETKFDENCLPHSNDADIQLFSKLVLAQQFKDFDICVCVRCFCGKIEF